MNRALPLLNLLGVAALAALCVLQWQANRRVNLEASSLEKTRLEQASKLAGQEKTLKGLTADLEDFRERLQQTSAVLKAAEEEQAQSARQVRQLTAEREQLQASITNWTAAVAARDEQLKLANEQLRKSATERNEAVSKFNDLAARFNAVVKDLNETRSKATNASVTVPALVR